VAAEPRRGDEQRRRELDPGQFGGEATASGAARIDAADVLRNAAAAV